MAPSTVVGTAYMTFFGGLTAWGLYGAIYTALLLTNIVVSSVLSWAVLVVTQMISPIIGIAFSLIIVRVGLGIASDGTAAAGSAMTTSSGRVEVSFDRQDDVETGLPRDDTSATDEGGISPQTPKHREKRGVQGAFDAPGLQSS
ncbi:hypothetical protein CALCODRAFT_517933 [Calocera cornea HHB12733]|uniref:Uncharacterized protein n=1 Tax=Calocera cornea HHB12733 TaxID=1353952 RepID=A0A165FG88_9BASI|nr:hypothetical protein CALCODRAFT_517933 [Calocera cornea HHB12733]